jgi:hypothetical protein
LGVVTLVEARGSAGEKTATAREDNKRETKDDESDRSVRAESAEHDGKNGCFV